MLDGGVAVQDGGRLEHCVPWQEGNGEDGYLTGVQNLVELFESLAIVEYLDAVYTTDVKG